MRCTNKAATEAAAWMRAAGDRATEPLAAGVSSPDAIDKRPAVPNVADERDHLHAASSSAASTAGGSPIDVDPEI